jgi:mycofactocin system glycosyltransferase
MLRRRYWLSRLARLVSSRDGHWLVCTHPMQWIRLNGTAWEMLRQLDGQAWLHELAKPIAPELTAYLDGLAERGLLGVEYRAERPSAWPRIHVVVPAHGMPGALARCLAGLRALEYPADRLAVTVVDDGSPEPLAALLGEQDVSWVRRERNGGPADARNAGVAALEEAAEQDLLAFLDSDCVPDPAWLREAAAILEEPGPSAVGGAVAGLRRATWLERYEDACSPLHMGSRPGRTGVPGAPVPYLPACQLVMRVRAFRAVGGFRPGWRMGEDVDLSWRLAAVGESLFYWPDLRVRHDHRARFGAFLARRWDYARSEGPLALAHRHRFARAPGGWMVLGGLAAAGIALHLADSLASAATGGLALTLLGAPDAGRIARGWRSWPSDLPRPRVRAWAAALARMWAARVLQESRLLVRQWLLWLVLLAVTAPGIWPMLLAVVSLGAWGEWRARSLSRQSALRPHEFLAGWLLDCLAYSFGRLIGHAKARLGLVRMLGLPTVLGRARDIE